MKQLSLLIILSFSIFNSQFSILHCQSHKVSMDSTYFYMGKSNYEAALKWIMLAIPLAEKVLGKKDTNYAATLGYLPIIYYRLGKLDSAVFYQKIHLDICRQVYNSNNLNLANSILNMAVFYNGIGDFINAEPYFIEAMEMFRQIYKTDHPGLALSLDNTAQFYNARGDFKKAEQLFQEALAMKRRIFKMDNPELALGLNNIGAFYNARGDYKKAESFFIEALDIYRRIYPTDNPSLANSINSMAVFYDTRGFFDKAEPLYIEALDMRRRIFKTDHPSLASSINNMGAFYNAVGEYRKAEELLLEALAMNRRMYKTDHPDLARSINNIATFYNWRGIYKLAEPLFIEALMMRRRIFKTDHPDLAQSINNIAAFYKDIGDVQKAEPLYIELLNMYRRMFHTDHQDLALVIKNTAIFYNETGNYSKAEELFDEAVLMSRRLYKTDHPSYANIITTFARFKQEKGDIQEALALFIEGLAMNRRIYKSDHLNLAYSINSLGVFYNDIDAYDKAEPLLKESLDMYRRIFNFDSPDLAISINNMAKFYKLTGDYVKAEQFYLEALKMYNGIITNYFPSLSEIEKERFWSKFKDNFESFNSFAISRMIDNPSILLNLYDNYLLTKGFLLNSTQKVRRNILNSGDKVLINQYEKWMSVKKNLARLQTQSPKDLDNKGINLDSIISAANDMEKVIGRSSEDYTKDYNKKQYKCIDVLNILNSDEAAIEMVGFRYYDKRWTDTVYYAALLVKDTSSVPELVLLNNGNDLEGKYIEEYRNQAGQFKKRVYDPDKVNGKLKELYSQFWAPIQEKLKGIKTVYLSPDGVYNLINLNTLINPESGKYLLEELDLRLVTSTRDLVNRSLPLNPSQEWDTSLNPLSRGENIAELFGDPQFDLDSTKYELLASNIKSNTTREYYFLPNALDSATRGSISSLPGTRKEIENIANSFQEQGWEVNKHLGPEALEEALKALDNPRVLHIATHGKFLKDVERRDDERLMGFETQRFVENPLLRSMLLFSGAENTLLNQGQQSATQREDGLLTAYEAQSLNLDNTELVVLSACETGLGEIKNGEGVYGLQRAFQVAGAKSLIMSLWSVSDEATQELMTSFYSKWLEGKSKREAFREAQMELKKKYPGFYYWGAFVMVGE